MRLALPPLELAKFLKDIIHVHVGDIHVHAYYRPHLPHSPSTQILNEPL